MLISAFTDPRLPHLRQAADEAQMLTAFRAYLDQTYPNQAPPLSACDVDQIRYKPDRYCRFLYRLHFADGMRQWVLGQMPLQGEEPAAKKQQAWAKLPPLGWWQPLAFWAALGMQLQVFPHDKSLTQVPPLLEPDHVCRLAQAAGLEETAVCAAAVVQPVKYMPGKRCVLRYDLTWQGEGEPWQTAVYSKTYGKGDGQPVYDALVALEQHSQGGFAIPKPLAYFAESNTIWQAAWVGTDYTDMIIAGDWLRHLPTIAQHLAKLHQQTPPDMIANAPSEVSLTAVLANAREQETDVNEFFDQPRPELRHIVTELEARYPALAAQSTPQTLVHGTFKISQIMVNGDKIALVDFDSVAVGDPWYDVAEFISSLLTLEAKHNVAAEQIVAGIQTFLHRYAAAVPWPCDVERIRWYATAFVAARLHSLLKGLKVQTEADFLAALDCLETLLPAALAGVRHD